MPSVSASNQGRTEAPNNKVRLIMVTLNCGPIILQPPHELRL